ncbi:MAG: two-component system, chemotaxis family, protein-glutamate methylesterase/glutaminase [Sphingomonadales bacterium]|nr:two-component system, chemotaxis family, protein-glutamate methylesterase/glutaminase [Sphingomonadales bacterium]
MSPPAAVALKSGGPPLRDAPAPLRLLIVDDSTVARAVLSRMLRAQPGFEVAGEAASAEEALALLARIEVDVVLLDVEMPGTTGLDALPAILAAGRGARVLIVSCLCEEGAEAAVQAMALGAADTLPKPGAQNFGGRFSQVLTERLRRLGQEAPSEPTFVSAQPPVALREPSREPLGCVAFGASTGGLHAIGELLRALPQRIGAPILVAQHLPALFMPFFARQLETASGRPVSVAVEEQALRADEILLAPGHAHLGLEQQGGRVLARLLDQPSESGCMPSVDVTLGEVAEIYGKRGLGIVLSGMGRDGLAGARRLVERGGEILVQDRATSAVWGMPRGIAEAGLASAVLPPAELAARIAARSGAARW